MIPKLEEFVYKIWYFEVLKHAEFKNDINHFVNLTDFFYRPDFF